MAGPVAVTAVRARPRSQPAVDGMRPAPVKWSGGLAGKISIGTVDNDAPRASPALLQIMGVPDDQLAPSAVNADTDDDAEHRLTAYLARHDAVCPLCRCNLRGLTSARCPECGQALRLTVGLAEPFLRAWILLVASAWAGAGVGLLFLVTLLLQGLPSGPPVICAAIVCLTADIPVGVLALVLRRRLLKLRRGHQWAIAWATVVITGVGYLLFLVQIIAS